MSELEATPQPWIRRLEPEVYNFYGEEEIYDEIITHVIENGVDPDTVFFSPFDGGENPIETIRIPRYRIQGSTNKEWLADLKYGERPFTGRLLSFYEGITPCLGVYDTEHMHSPDANLGQFGNELEHIQGIDVNEALLGVFIFERS